LTVPKRKENAFYSLYDAQSQGRQCKYSVTLMRLRVTIVAVKKQRVLHVLSVC
jgi:hypothetical protein